MSFIARVLLGTAVITMLLTAPALAGKRVALIIGNGGYANVSKLPNPTRDAAAVEGMLRTAGFDTVKRVTDLSGVAMRRALRDFSDDVRDADIAMVFYAGHGLEVNGSNYLIPVDAALERDIDVEDEAVSLDRVNQVLEGAKRLRLIILDACRDNPFVRSMKRTLGTRSIGRGLAKVEVASSDTLVAYAAKAGSTAGDGDGTNSPYTLALIKHLATPGLDIRLALGQVRDAVLASTSNKQEPFVYGSLGGAQIALVPGSETAASPPATITAPPSAAEPVLPKCERYYEKIKDSQSIDMLKFYLKECADTFHGALVKTRLAKLETPPPAVHAPPAAKAPLPTASANPMPAFDIDNALVMELKSGKVTIQLRPDLAPYHVGQIKYLTKQGFYDGLKFHRVIDGFMAQTGDPSGTGTGGSNLGNLKAEFSGTETFKRGTVGAARTADPNSANSQFFICFTDASCSSLNGKYTIWGQVVSGMEYVDKIARGEPPAKPDVIVKMTVAGTPTTANAPAAADTTRSAAERAAECSRLADERNLHDEARRAFRAQCKSNAVR